MNSSQLFQNVFIPVFTTKLAQMGITVRDDKDVGNLLKLAGQLKMAGVKSSLELRSESYKVATEKVAQYLRLNVAAQKQLQASN